MKNFDTRWKDMANTASKAEPRDEQIPFGFAARVVSRAFPVRSSSVDVTWDRLLVRFLLGAVAALALCTTIEWQHLHDTHPLDPGIENTVAQLVWTL
ncbi:MAG: hypothetical protein FJ405_16300 [Verrucomicrobia bacterium]|nr:hypothetical protein [Verrucomicrobiota bacterium]